MPLNSFGAILSFAEALETRKKDFYHAAVKKGLDPEIDALFKSLASEGDKQIKLIQRTRRENVTEMILEPVRDFFRQSFAIDTGISDRPDQVVLTARKNEDISLAFYSEASLKLAALSEVSRTLKQLAKKQKSRLEKLNRI